MRPTNLITRFLLLFCKKRYQIQLGLYDKRVEYKRLFGKTYFISEYYLPPSPLKHPNCRCITIPVKETEWTAAPE